jgi:hypothetical protein
MIFITLSEFEKDLKKLAKKYPSIHKDLELRKKVLQDFPYGRSHTDAAEISGLKINKKIFKARLMCASLKQQSLRIIYCYEEELAHITLIEIYFKGEKEVEDRERIFRNFQ